MINLCSEDRSGDNQIFATVLWMILHNAEMSFFYRRRLFQDIQLITIYFLKNVLANFTAEFMVITLPESCQNLGNQRVFLYTKDTVS